MGGDAREREGCVVLVMERVESGGRGIGWAHHLQGALGQRALGPVSGLGWKKNEHFLTWCIPDYGVITRQLMGGVLLRYGQRDQMLFSFVPSSMTPARRARLHRR